MRTSAMVLFAGVMALAGCGDDTGTGGTGAIGWTGGAGGTGGGGGGGAGGEDPVTTCIDASGDATMGSDTWIDGDDEATVTIEDRDTCRRTYRLQTTAALRDNLPENPRSFAEEHGQPIVRTGNDMFDALYALAIEESRENSVESISNFAFNGGQAIPCAAGGCFETGRLWTYVWTRDTSYAVALGLAAVDPVRAKNSLEFKTSARRDGTGVEIVQDTGTGGSWPISSDRVVWAMGAWELQKHLAGAERTAFVELAYQAIVDTAEHDRAVVFDAADGLYRGEQSFLDWREQTYPAWTATDPVQIGMSKSLSTNIGHMRMLEVAAAFATEQGDGEAADKYAGWAAALKTAIRQELWLEDEGLYSTYKPTPLDAAPVRRFDLLGEAFAVLFDVASPGEAEEILASYPHLPKGPAVAWPQQQNTPIYHNRAMWPFVTAYWARAAAKTGNAAVLDHSLQSLMRGAAMNLSNMENFEIASGAAWFDDGAASGPVVNSQRQLWSVAGYLGVVNDVVFGMETGADGLRFHPRITGAMARTFFGGAASIALSNLTYKGKRVSVVVQLPADLDGDGFFSVEGVTLNGVDAGEGFIDAADLAEENVFEVRLGNASGGAGTITLLSEADVGAYKNVFGPKTPTIATVAVEADRLKVTWDAAGETGVTFDVYRDGVRVAWGLTDTTWTDPNSGDHATVTHCYSVDASFTDSGTTSQHARAICYWGATNQRISSFSAQNFAAQGGTLVMNHGRWHYEDWGDPSDTLTIANVVPAQSGEHLLQVVAGNGAGDTTTGVTCAVKSIEVWNGGTRVGGGYLVMPHLGAWSEWRDSNVVSVDLVAGTNYTVVIKEDVYANNMSDLDHFSLYGGSGGTGGRFNKVNITELKMLYLRP